MSSATEHSERPKAKTPAAVSSGSARELRAAFARFVTGVVIVSTAKPAGGWAAVTVNSFTSVSLDPPLLLWCLGRQSNCRRYFERAPRFTASVLGHDQQRISNNFARPSTSSWIDLPFVRSAEGDLLIQGALASFQCTAHARHRGGDHTIFIGRVEKFSVGDKARPLGFFRGSYGSFTQDQGESTEFSAASASITGNITFGWE